MVQDLQKYNRIIKRGFSLVEVVIASSLISVFLVSIVASYVNLSKYTMRNIHALKASSLAEEGGEIIKTIRDGSWDTYIESLSLNTTYRFYWNGSAWTATSGVFWVDNKFDRTFILSAVERDANYNVVASGGTVDSGSRKVVTTVAWRESEATTTRASETYIFDVFGN